jgi:hypothetical protein
METNQPTYRGMRVNGVRVATWSSRDGWSGDSRPEADWVEFWEALSPKRGLEGTSGLAPTTRGGQLFGRVIPSGSLVFPSP